MASNGKYKFSESDRAEVYWGFCEWLEIHAGEEAEAAFCAIMDAELFNTAFQNYPENMINIRQKRAITSAKKHLAKTASWLIKEAAQSA